LINQEQFSALLSTIREERTGNGWNSEEVDVKISVFRPISPSQAIAICDNNKTKLFGLFRRPKKEDVRITTMHLEFIPY